MPETEHPPVVATNWTQTHRPGRPSRVRACYALDKKGNVVMVHLGEGAQPVVDDSDCIWTDGKGARDMALEDYNARWDEAKRCPYAKDGSPRYKLASGVLTPTASVANIDYDSARMTLNADGTLTWK